MREERAQPSAALASRSKRTPTWQAMLCEPSRRAPLAAACSRKLQLAPGLGLQSNKTRSMCCTARRPEAVDRPSQAVIQHCCAESWPTAAEPVHEFTRFILWLSLLIHLGPAAVGLARRVRPSQTSGVAEGWVGGEQRNRGRPVVEYQPEFRGRLIPTWLQNLR